MHLSTTNGGEHKERSSHSPIDEAVISVIQMSRRDGIAVGSGVIRNSVLQKMVADLRKVAGSNDAVSTAQVLEFLRISRASLFRIPAEVLPRIPRRGRNGNLYLVSDVATYATNCACEIAAEGGK